MSILLFHHNMEAYKAATAMLEEKGKAAVIHPTGTGKSFIGFKLCEDHPDKTICWLSPSEYIFQTQLENLAQVADGWQPDNIKFYTYARLTMMAEEEMLEIQPDYLIVDEYHRLGAECWGAAFQTLLSLYPDVPMLGLSATNIRYLDNQRDMAEELFEGHCASIMTLGQAIVCGILSAPKYVLSMFSYQQELEKYEKLVKSNRYSIVRDTAEQYLEALRRTLEKADDVDKVFAKHMADDPHGKYIVFCANYEHLSAMVALASDWFKDVDSELHIYKAYSGDPTTSKDFQKFKEDTSEHLRLLYCIDMLNEGVHVDDISGVILLRPTVSPIIYKQQIGRALTAGKKKTPVIFDIVMNIENLYSIDAVEEEMELATVYYRSLGENHLIVNEHFQVIDELRDCRALFDKLENVLMASWDTMYEHAVEYYKNNGNLEVPARYKTPDGYSLGCWLFNQKAIRRGQQTGSLSDEQIAKLDAIGMIWGDYSELNWERNFAAAQKYHAEYGNLSMPTSYVTEDGIRLGSWICAVRTWERSGAHPKYLTEERKAQLEELGMIWDKIDYFWERNYMSALEYYKKHGDLNIPTKYVDENGFRLGLWLGRMRKLRQGIGRGKPPTQDQIQRLDAIGMIWLSAADARWEKGFEEAKVYADQHDDLLVPSDYKTESGYALGSWIRNQRSAYKKGSSAIMGERARRLEEIGMVWDTRRTWEQNYEAVLQYLEVHGDISMSTNYVVDGVWLGKWLQMQKQAYEQHEKLTDTQRELMAKLLTGQPDAQYDYWMQRWMEGYEEVAEYFREHGTITNIPVNCIGKNGMNLNNWVTRQRAKWKKGELSELQIKLLNEIGFQWKLEAGWSTGYRHAKAYFDKYGDLLVKYQYVCEDGYCLGSWIRQMRKAYREKTIDPELTALLDKIGMVWLGAKEKYAKKTHDTSESLPILWDMNFAIAKEYFIAHGTVFGISKKSTEYGKLYSWLQNQRKSYREGRLHPDQLEQLASIGITEDWLNPQSSFYRCYTKAKAYFELHGHLNVKSGEQTEDGFWIGSWVRNIRKKKNDLTEEQRRMLSDIGFVW